MQGCVSGDGGRMDYEAIGSVGGAAWNLSYAVVPSPECAFYVQYVQGPQFFRDGEADPYLTEDV